MAGILLGNMETFVSYQGLDLWYSINFFHGSMKACYFRKLIYRNHLQPLFNSLVGCKKMQMLHMHFCIILDSPITWLEDESNTSNTPRVFGFKNRLVELKMWLKWSSWFSMLEGNHLDNDLILLSEDVWRGQCGQDPINTQESGCGSLTSGATACSRGLFATVAFDQIEAWWQVI